MSDEMEDRDPVVRPVPVEHTILTQDGRFVASFEDPESAKLAQDQFGPGAHLNTITFLPEGVTPVYGVRYQVVLGVIGQSVNVLYDGMTERVLFPATDGRPIITKVWLDRGGEVRVEIHGTDTIWVGQIVQRLTDDIAAGNEELLRSWMETFGLTED